MYALAIDLYGLKQEIYKGYPIGISTLFYQFILINTRFLIKKEDIIILFFYFYIL